MGFIAQDDYVSYKNSYLENKISIVDELKYIEVYNGNIGIWTPRIILSLRATTSRVYAEYTVANSTKVVSDTSSDELVEVQYPSNYLSHSTLRAEALRYHQAGGSTIKSYPYYSTGGIHRFKNDNTSISAPIQRPGLI